jgi:hypothetical protein
MSVRNRDLACVSPLGGSSSSWRSFGHSCCVSEPVPCSHSEFGSLIAAPSPTVWSLLTAPYYRSRWNVGSPPLAIRTGMMALGIFPFILAFASKFNIVTFVTGYSHEKLQVFHQWFSYLFLILSLLHTFPFVMAGREIRPNTDGKNPTHMTQIGYSWHIGKVVSIARTCRFFLLSVSPRFPARSTTGLVLPCWSRCSGYVSPP